MPKLYRIVPSIAAVHQQHRYVATMFEYGRKRSHQRKLARLAAKHPQQHLQAAIDAHPVTKLPPDPRLRRKS